MLEAGFSIVVRKDTLMRRISAVQIMPEQSSKLLRSECVDPSVVHTE